MAYPACTTRASCVVMAQLHRQGVIRAYREASAERVRLRALVRQREVFETPLRLHLGMLEGLCGRHWPELLAEMDVWRRRTPLELLAAYGSPAELAAHETEARELMRRTGRNAVKPEQIQRVVDSAKRSVGLPASQEEREVVRMIAREALRLRSSTRNIDEEIRKVGEVHDDTRRIATVVGRVTAVVLVAYLGPLSESRFGGSAREGVRPEPEDQEQRERVRSTVDHQARRTRGSRLPVPRRDAAREGRRADRGVVPRARRLPRRPQADRARRGDAQARARALARRARRDVRLDQARRRTCARACAVDRIERTRRIVVFARGTGSRLRESISRSASLRTLARARCSRGRGSWMSRAVEASA